jgi:hypothetical protein
MLLCPGAMALDHLTQETRAAAMESVAEGEGEPFCDEHVLLLYNFGVNISSSGSGKLQQ